MTALEPYRIDVPDHVLDDLTERLGHPHRRLVVPTGVANFADVRTFFRPLRPQAGSR